MKAIDNLYDFTSKRVKKLQADINSLLEHITTVNADIAQKEEIEKKLSDEIKSKQQKVADLALIETKRDTAVAELANINAEIAKLEAQAEAKKRHLLVFEAFEGYVQSTSLEKMEEFIGTMPKLMEDVKIGTYSPNVIRNYIFERLTGGTLKVLKCLSCGVTFYVNKPADSGDYHCPICWISSKVVVEKNEVDILRTTLAIAEPKNVRYSTAILVKSPPTKVTTVSDATGEPGNIGKKIE